MKRFFTKVEAEDFENLDEFVDDLFESVELVEPPPDKPERTATERDFLHWFSSFKKRKLTVQEENLALEQARSGGELPEHDECFDEHGQRQKLHS